MKVAQLVRLIQTCEQALATCTMDAEPNGGYRAAQRVRTALLGTELANHRVQLDAVNAEIATLEGPAAHRPKTRRLFVGFRLLRAAAAPMRWRRTRSGLIAAAAAAAILLLAALLPIDQGLGLIPTLVATEEDVIVVDPRTLSWGATSIPVAYPVQYATPEVPGARP